MNLDLKIKSDESLIVDLKAMVAEERRLQTRILHYLLEVQDRKLYLQKGYPHLFDFVTQELGYSEPAAHRRIQAMRLMKEVPEVEGKLESGKLSLSVAAKAQSFIRQENKKRKEEQRELISTDEKRELVHQLEGVSARECDKKLIVLSPETALPREKTRPLTEDRTLIQFVADGKLMKKIERLKSLMAHQNYEGRYDKLFEKVVDLALEKMDPEQREIRRKKETVQRQIEKTLSESSKNSDKVFISDLPTTTSELESAPRNRHIPQAIRDKIWVRDHGECQYQDPVSGKTCGSRHGLQLDHIQPYSAGGGHAPENLRLLCSAHNRHRTVEMFG